MTEDEPPYDPYLEALQAKSGKRHIRELVPQLRRGFTLIAVVGSRSILTIATLQVALALCAAAEVLITKVALANLLHHPTLREALPPLIALILTNALIGAISIYQTQRQALISELVVRSSWDRLLRVTVSVPLLTFEDSAYYDRLQRIRVNALTRPLQVVQGMMALFGGSLGVVGLLLALLVVQPLLVSILAGAALPLYFIARLGGRIEFDFAVQQTQNVRQRYALLDLLTDRAAAKEVRAFALASYLGSKHTKLYDDYMAALRRKVRRKSSLALLAALTTAVVASGAVTLLVVFISDGRVSLSVAGAAVVAIALLASKIEQVFGGAATLLESGMFMRDLEAFLAMVGEPAKALAQPEVTFECLKLHNVSFTYPGQQAPALTDVSLSINRGDVIAVVGANGSGKTTLSKLMANLYIPTDGHITWDGRDTRSMDSAALGRSIAVLFQDFVRYELSFFENIAVGNPMAAGDEDAVVAASQAAGADRVAEGLPEGLATFLSSRFPNGLDLSTGQWQRVAMARALFRDAPFVILDEPTAALDARAEMDLYRTVKTLLRGRTVLLVTHRLASALEADHIIVLDHGRIAEQGTHSELLRIDGIYAEMFNLQANAFRQDLNLRLRR